VFQELDRRTNVERTDVRFVNSIDDKRRIQVTPSPQPLTTKTLPPNASTVRRALDEIDPINGAPNSIGSNPF
jgi:hypothetical protein